MRLIGHIPDEVHALRFGDYLLTQGMANNVEPSSQGWAIWVHDDDALPRAAQFLADFLADPDDARYVKRVRRTARSIRLRRRIL